MTTILTQGVADKERLLFCEIKISKSYKEYRKIRKKRDYHYIFSGWAFDAPYAFDLLNTFTTGHSSNHALWSDKKYDQMIADIQSEANMSSALKKSNEAEAYLYDQHITMPVIDSREFIRHAVAPHLKREIPIKGKITIDFVAIEPISE